MATLYRRIRASADDARESTAGVVTLTDIALESDDVNEWLGFRFQDMLIPPGATITACTLALTPAAGTLDEPDHQFWGHDADNAGQFTTGSNDISGRSRTSATVTWSSANLGASGSNHFNVPDMSAVLQEVVDRPGWAMGNAVVFVCRGSADPLRDLSVVSFDNSPSLAAHLTVSFTVPTGYVGVSEQVGASADDASQSGTTVSTSGTAPDVDATNEWFGFRFQTVAVPQGATITAAWLSVMPISTSNPDHPIYAEDTDDAAAFTTTANDISGRSRTTATVTWSSTSDLAALGSDLFISTPNLAALIQEVVDRGGWASGNDMAIIINGSAVGTRDLTVWMYDQNPSVAPKLEIIYEVTVAPIDIDLDPVDVEVDIPALTLHQPIGVILEPADVDVDLPEIVRSGGIPYSFLVDPVTVEVEVPGFESFSLPLHIDLAPVDVEVDLPGMLLTEPQPEGRGGGGATGITVYSPDGTLVASTQLVLSWKAGRHLNSVGDWEMTIPALEPLVNGVPLASLLRTGWLVDIRHEGSRVYDRLDRPHLMYHGEIEDVDFDIAEDGTMIANIPGSFRTIRLASRATPTSAQYENVPMVEVAADIEGGLCDGIIVPVNATRTIGLGFNNDNGNAILTMYARLLRLGEYARWYLRESWDRDRPEFIPQDRCPNSGYVLTNMEAVGDAAYLAGRKGVGIITGQPKVRREGRGVYNRILGFSTGRKLSVDSISRAGTLVMTEQPTPGSTLTIEGRDYTFTNGLLSYNETTKMAHVPVGATLSNAIGLLRSAISEGLTPIPPHQRISIGLVASDGGDGFEAPIYWRGVSRESNAIDFSGDAFGDSDSSANYIDTGSADPAVAQESSYALTVSAATNSVPYAPQEGTNPDGTKYNYIEDQESIDLYGLRETMMNRQDIRAADSTAEAQAAAANVLLLTMYSELLKVKSPKIFVDLEGLGADIWALPGDRLYVRYTGSVLLNGSRVTQMDLTGWWMVTDREDAVSDPTGVRRVNLTLAAPEISIQIPELLEQLGLSGGDHDGHGHGSLTTGLSPVPGEGIEGGPEAPDETFPIPTPSPLPPILTGPLPAPNPGAGPFGGNGGGALWPNCCPDPTTSITSIGQPVTPPPPPTPDELRLVTTFSTSVFGSLNDYLSKDSVLIVISGVNNGTPDLTAVQDCIVRELQTLVTPTLLSGSYTLTAWAVETTGDAPEVVSSEPSVHICRYSANKNIPNGFTVFSSSNQNTLAVVGPTGGIIELSCECEAGSVGSIREGIGSYSYRSSSALDSDGVHPRMTNLFNGFTYGDNFEVIPSLEDGASSGMAATGYYASSHVGTIHYFIAALCFRIVLAAEDES